MRYAYPFDMEAQPEGGFTVTFPDVPEAITEGDTAGEARERAEDALVTALSFYTDEGKPLPAPSAPRGRPVAILPPLVAAKLALRDAMLAAGLSNVELGRRLDLDEKAVPSVMTMLISWYSGWMPGFMVQRSKMVPPIPTGRTSAGV